jgi:type IV pilus assembly protein PilC
VSVEPSTSIRDLAFFYRQLAAYIRSGLNPHQALVDLQASTRNRKIKNALFRMAERVRNGETLSASMAEFPHIFPVHATAQIWNGEMGGFLDKAVDEVASSVEEEVRDHRYGRFGWIIFKVSVISFILTIPAVDLKNLFLNGVKNLGTAPQLKIPNVDNLNSAGDLSQKLSSGITPMQMINAIMRGYLDVVVHVYLPFIIALCVFWWLWARLKRTPSIKRMLDSSVLMIPLWGSIQQERARARFARSFAQLSRNGIAPATAWDAASLTVRNSAIVEKLRACTPMLRQNMTMQDAFNRCGIYTPEAAGMIGTGERTGQVAEMSERLADYHDNIIVGLKSQAKMWAIHGLILMTILMFGYTTIQSVRTYLTLQTETLPQILGIPGL